MNTKPSATKPQTGFFRIVRHFWPEVRRHRLLIAGSLAAFFAEAAIMVLEPWPLKFIFDRVITVKHTIQASGIALIDSLPAGTLLIAGAIAIVVLSGLRAFTAYLNTVGFAVVGNRVMTSVRNDLYNHIQCLPLSFHTKARSGDLLVRIISDVSLLQEVLITAALPLFGHTVKLIAMVAVMLWMNLRLGMVAVGILPFFWWFTVRMSGRIQEVARKQRHIQGTMAATASEAVNAIRTVQALSLEDTFSKSFAANSDKVLREEMKGKRLAARLERTVDLLIAFGTAIAILYGGYLVIHTKLTPGDLLVFIAYFKNAFKPLSDFAKYTGRLSKATASGERILELFNLTPQIRDLPGAVRAHGFKGEVQFKNVDFAYEEGIPVLQDVNFLLHPGEHILLSAPSGTGKTTLVSLLMRLYEPSRGQILIDGKDIRGYTIDSLRSQISVVLQDTLLFAASVSDNIAYGTTGATQEEIEEAARLSNAHDFIQEMPEGYRTVLGERGVTLSQGQRQRIAVARAVIRKSPILILDEPAVNLDKKNETELNNALEKLTRGRTAILITHDPQWLKKVDRVFYLEGGKLFERALPKSGEIKDTYLSQQEEVRQYYPAVISGSKRVSVVDHFGVSRDPEMPFLRTAIGAVRAQEHLNRSLHKADDPKLKDASARIRGIRVRRYKPGRRCLIQYDIASGKGQENITLLGKARSKGLDLATYQLQLTLWNNGFSSESPDKISIPRPVATIPEFNMWLYRKASGFPLTQFLPGPQGVSLARRVAQSARKVHTCAVPAPRSHTIEDELDILRQRLDMVTSIHPQWEKRIQALLQGCEEIAASVPAAPMASIYRDFYSDNILVDGERLYLLDFDLYCKGDPALDIGNFIGHLKELGLRHYDNADKFIAIEEELKKEFLRLSMGVDLRSIEVYTTLTLARHIYLSTQFLERQPFTEKIMELSQQRIDAHRRNRS